MSLSGLVLAALGGWIFTERLVAYLSVCIVFAIAILFTGCMEILFIIFTRRASGVTRWALLGAFIDLFVGFYLWFYPMISLIVVPIVLGFWLLLRGIVAIASAWQLRDQDQDDWVWLLLCGLLIILTDIMLLTNIIWGTNDLILQTGIGFIVAGLFRIYLGFRLRSFKTPAKAQ